MVHLREINNANLQKKNQVYYLSSWTNIHIVTLRKWLLRSFDTYWSTIKQFRSTVWNWISLAVLFFKLKTVFLYYVLQHARYREVVRVRHLASSAIEYTWLGIYILESPACGLVKTAKTLWLNVNKRKDSVSHSWSH